MLKYFVLSVFLLALTWQTFGEDQIAVKDDFDVTPVNNTDGIIIPQPRYAQFSVSDKTYTFIFTPVNWYTAVELCNSQNQVIATITSSDESSRIYDTLYMNRLVNTGSNFWLGATDLGHHGRWTWFNTGRPLFYTNWGPGEPNNGYNREHCLQLLSNGQWNDYDCDSQQLVICQNRPSC
ncbi:perlucin-like [Calliphora vicina]|uniref:perlucin-like n=1 Tax=Calliphora vicina TaxID=7373 RepID=UPI00325BD9DA